MLDQLGLEARFYRGDAKRQMQKEIEIIRGVHGQRVVCVLDEAHLLEKETIEEHRFLLNYRFDSVSPMALILVGQTELWEDKLRLKRYEAVISAEGSQFHIIFGSCQNGSFLCIPGWHTGCELSYLDDVFWNHESILGSDERFGYENATAIAYALKELKLIIK